MCGWVGGCGCVPWNFGDNMYARCVCVCGWVGGCGCVPWNFGDNMYARCVCVWVGGWVWVCSLELW